MFESNRMEVSVSSHDEEYQLDFILTEFDSILGQDKSYV